MKTQLLLLSILIHLLGSNATHAQSPAPLLFQTPTISRDHIAFSYAGDIWLVERAGGTARRITTTVSRETSPVFSPDGSQLAFTRLNSALGPFGWDVYVVKVDQTHATGDEQRITY
jgi:tricorn protease